MSDCPPYEPDGVLPFEPPGLREIINSLEYKPDWKFFFRTFSEEGEIRGWQLNIFSHTPNSLDISEDVHIQHTFLVPPLSWNRDNWIAWIFDRVRDVETHEAGEFFRVNGERPFAPPHSPDEDSYRVWHHTEEKELR
jgi:hypothetical protein